MPGTTPGGFPYVLPSDKPLEYPALSEQLANAVDDGFAGTLSTWVPGTVFNPNPGLLATRVGSIVIIQGNLILNTALTVTTGQFRLIGNVPLELAPDAVSASPTVYSGTPNNYGNPGQIFITPDGEMTLYPSANGTIPIGGGICVLSAYRKAAL